MMGSCINKLVKGLLKSSGLLALTLITSMQAQAFQMPQIGNMHADFLQTANKAIDYGLKAGRNHILPALKNAPKSIYNGGIQTLSTLGKIGGGCWSIAKNLFYLNPVVSTFIAVSPLAYFLFKEYEKREKDSGINSPLLALKSRWKGELENIKFSQSYRELYSLIPAANQSPTAEALGINVLPFIMSRNPAKAKNARIYLSRPELLKMMVTSSVEALRYITRVDFNHILNGPETMTLVAGDLLKNLSILEGKNLDKGFSARLVHELYHSNSKDGFLAQALNKIIIESLDIESESLRAEISASIKQTLPTILQLAETASRIGISRKDGYTEKFILYTIEEITSDMIAKDIEKLNNIY